MTKEDFYTKGEYLAKHPEWHTEDAAWKASNILKMLGKNNLHPSSVIEIGCGAGEILKKMQDQLPATVNFEGYEVSPQAFEMTSSRKNERLNFFLKDISEIKSNRSYDLSLMIDVFEHVHDYYGFLEKARDKAKHIIFHIPLDLSVQSVWRGYPLLRKRKNSGHIHYFTKDTALASLRDSGYEIVDWFYTGSYIDLPTKTLKSKIAKIPRQILFAINPDFGVRVLGGYSLMVLAK
ncbi:MAG TPA: class I SAM-dependent methyltransferase [Bacteroidia bacterium]|nr:class I SAM-dependent methyltransferase [Bacteroidia bacterium]